MLYNIYLNKAMHYQQDLTYKLLNDFALIFKTVPKKESP